MKKDKVTYLSMAILRSIVLANYSLEATGDVACLPG